MASEKLVVETRYHGFVHADTNSKTMPQLEHVSKAKEMLAKKNLKKTRDIHPLFGRGFDTPLSMEVSVDGLKVFKQEGGQETVLLNSLLHKIAFVANIGATVGVIVKRPGVGKFKCHMFEFASAEEASKVCQTLAQVTNDAFRKLRKVSVRLRKKRTKSLTSKKHAGFNSDWFFDMGDGEVAKFLTGFSDGVFLLRTGETDSDILLSVVHQKAVTHHRITVDAEGHIQFGGESYNSPDEFISRHASRPGKLGCRLTEPAPKEGGTPRWDEATLQEVINEVDQVTSAPESEAGESSSGEQTIQYDPLFDDSRFGFGNEFVILALGAKHTGGEVELDGSMFDGGSLARLDEEMEC